MSDRRIVSSSLSARIVQYLREQGRAQVEIARMLGVSEPFISLVKSKERSLTLDHVERLAESLGVPMGALLLAMTPSLKDKKGAKNLFNLSAEVLKKADIARRAVLRGEVPSSR